MSSGDLTTKYFVSNKSQVVKAKVIAKEAGVLAGILEAEWFLAKLGIKIIKKRKDGSMLKVGDLIMSIEGRADKLLGAERTLLNLLQRMSGVATTTKELGSKLPKSIKLLATRKTLWGELDKRAVSVGGGSTHRLNLNDAILIKENHIALADDHSKGFKRVFGNMNKTRFIEIELENLLQVCEFALAFESTSKKIVVMLDNFTPGEVRKAVELLNGTGVTVEVSGGIDKTNIKKYAVKGVSAISSGSITNKADALDISLNFA